MKKLLILSLISVSAYLGATSIIYKNCNTDSDCPNGAKCGVIQTSNKGDKHLCLNGDGNPIFTLVGPARENESATKPSNVGKFPANWDNPVALNQQEQAYLAYAKTHPDTV